jgi:hypothetical protein
LPIKFGPPDPIDNTASEEEWTDSDRQHCERMLREAFEESFNVRMIQNTGIGLNAEDAPFVSFESMPFGHFRSRSAHPRSTGR